MTLHNRIEEFRKQVSNLMVFDAASKDLMSVRDDVESFIAETYRLAKEEGINELAREGYTFLKVGDYIYQRSDFAAKNIEEAKSRSKEEGLQEGEKKGREAERAEILAALPKSVYGWEQQSWDECMSIVYQTITSRTPHN